MFVIAVAIVFLKHTFFHTVTFKKNWSGKEISAYILCIYFWKQWAARVV